MKKNIVIDLKTNEHNLFSEVFYQVAKAKKRYAVVYGSANSGKSYSVHQNELIHIMTATAGDTLILRKHGVDLRESSFKLLNTIISQWGLNRYFKVTYSADSRKIVFLPTGRAIICKGLDDPERIKSIVGVRRIVMEEASEFKLEDFMELSRRARGFSDIQFVLILNPVSEKHWVKKQLCDADGTYTGKTDVLKFTYHNNKFALPEDIESLEILRGISENQYRVYALGEWGIEDRQHKYAWAFDESRHVAPVEHDPTKLTWLSFDFNVNPMSCSVIQHYDGEVKVVRCIRLAHSNTWEMCDRIKALYPGSYFHVTGDATGAHQSTASPDRLDNYKIIMRELGVTRGQVVVPTVNPRIEENQVKLNALFSHYPVSIDPINCQPLIHDLNYVEMNERLEIIKDRTSSKKFADFLDNFRYWVNIEFGDLGWFAG